MCIQKKAQFSVGHCMQRLRSWGFTCSSNKLVWLFHFNFNLNIEKSLCNNPRRCITHGGCVVKKKKSRESWSTHTLRKMHVQNWHDTHDLTIRSTCAGRLFARVGGHGARACTACRDCSSSFVWVRERRISSLKLHAAPSRKESNFQSCCFCLMIVSAPHV